MTDLCRICLFKLEPNDYVNIFTEKRKNELISHILAEFATIIVRETDSLPKSICLSCLNKLYSSYDFKALVIMSNIHLNKQNEEEEKHTCKPEVRCEENNENGNGIVCRSDSNQSVKENCVQHEALAINSNVHLNNLKEEVEDNVFEPVLKCEENNENGNGIVCHSKSNQPVRENSEEFETDKNKQQGAVKAKTRTYIYKCNICPATFKNSYRVGVHRREHTGAFEHICEICTKGFPTNYALTIHKRIHFDDRPFKCNKCEKSFKSPASLHVHKRTHLDPQPCQCKTCGKIFGYLALLKAHELIHTKEKHFICEICSKSFNQYSLLSKHQKTHKAKTSCPVCGKAVAYLRLHLKCHSDTKTKDYICEVCSKTFVHKSTLKTHMRIVHEGIKPFSCQVCTKIFSQSSILARHMRTHTGETPYSCSYCEKKFSYTHHRLSHMKREHDHHFK